jgi:hypothetical protein
MASSLSLGSAVTHSFRRGSSSSGR